MYDIIYTVIINKIKKIETSYVDSIISYTKQYTLKV